MRPMLTIVALTATLAGTATAQGTIAARVRAARDGEVRMQYASRPGTCGDGRDMIGFREAYFARNMQGFGRWSGYRCEPGPVRVSLQVQDGAPIAATTRVGGAWAAPAGAVTDLGTVSAPEAAAYVLSVLPALERGGRRDKGRALLPIVLADGFDAPPPLLAIARDESRNIETRRQALHWLGMLGDAKVVPALTAIARGANEAGGRVMGEGLSASVDPEKDGKKGLASAAAAALSMVEDGAGIPALVDLSRTGSVAVRRQAVFWLAQTDDERAHRAVRESAANLREDARVREHAVFSLAHGDPTDDDFRWLRELYARVDDSGVRKAVLMGMQEDESPEAGRWLLDRARDANGSMEVRKAAVFWAGQRKATPTKEIVNLYRSLDERSIREHIIFVLSQRDDDEATDALVAIVRAKDDPDMRRKALFWLGQKNDPRALKLIAELLK